VKKHLILTLVLLTIATARLFADPVDLKAIHKIIILGDSITHHEPAPSLEWTGDWGMGASTADKDWVHLFEAKLNDARGADTPKPEVLLFAEGGGKITGKIPVLDKITAYGADVALVQLGENDNTDVNQDGFQKPYEQLLAAIRAGNPNVHIFCAGVWGTYPSGPHEKDDMIKAACAKYGATFVDLGGAYADPANRASSQHNYPNPAVGWHPGDGGMAAYANDFWAALTGTTAPPPAAPAATADAAASAPAAAPAPAPTAPTTPDSTPVVEEKENWGQPTDLKWIPEATVVQLDGKNVAKASVTDATKDCKYGLVLNASEYAGRTITIKTRVKADSVSTPPQPYNGVKIMFRTQNAEGKVDFPGYPMPVGTYDWQEVTWSMRVPDNTVQLWFYIGLEKVSGTVWYDSIDISAGN
jgi:lysophospholipase L1-like esterase